MGWSQSRQGGGSGCVSRWKQSSVPGAKAASSATQVLWQSPSRVTLTVPGEGDAACAKDLPEEAPACRTCGEEACTWSGMALSSPANPTQPTGFTPCWGVPHCWPAGEGCPTGTGFPGARGTEPSSPGTAAARTDTLRAPLLPARDRGSCAQLPQGRQLWHCMARDILHLKDRGGE